MIVLHCSSCDTEIEVHEPVNYQTVVCPGCGGLLTKGPASTFTSPPGVVGGEPPPPSGQPADVESDFSDFRFLAPPRDGEEIGWLGRYRVLELLGKGGMALVFRAEDTFLQRQVALKVMKPDVAHAGLGNQRFLREARVIASLHNDHIVTIFEVGQEGAYPYLAMELLHGMPLDAWLKNNHPGPDEVVDLALQIARGLTAAHQPGLIHRDIKPSNIWVEEPGRRIKLLDFGLARQTQDASHLTHTGTVVGTPAYMAPEQADGQPVDERCDLFSLGCVLYELSTQRQAFLGRSTVGVLKAVALQEPPPLRQLNPALPQALDDLVKQLLAKDPAGRPASASQVVEALQAIARGQTAAALPPAAPPSAKPRAGPRRRKLVWLITALAGLALVVTLAVFALPGWRDGGADQGPPPVARTPSATAQGVTSTEVVLGISAPFNGPASALGHQMRVGLLTAFEDVNRRGGVAGRKIRLVPLDDGYEPDRAVANMEELFDKHKVFAVIGNVGTPTAEKSLPLALDRKMLFFGAFTGAGLLRKHPPDRFVFNYRASYEEETAAILKYFVEVKKIRLEEVAVFAQQDGYGDAGFHGVVKMVRKLGGDPDKLLRVGYTRNMLDVREAVQKIVQAPDLKAVIMVPTYRPAACFIQQLKDVGKDLLFANVSFVGSDALADELLQLGPQYGDGVIVTQVVPHPASQASAVLKYRELLARYHPHEKPSFVSLEGYLDALIFVHALEMVGDDLTTSSLIDALEAIHDLDLGIGTPITFGPSEHQASHRVWATVLDRKGQYQILDLD
jgi:ABC-type branched-subunit amino acid transport system substrate-binding protein/tRNA A-37 threonylcarbamoyl transferase component Bud32